MKYSILCVDFDGTLCSHEFPEIGKPNLHVIEFVKNFRKEGNKVILHTCRGGKCLEKALRWCERQGLEFDAINDDLPEIKETRFGKTKSKKIYANIYLDDKAVHPESLKILKNEYKEIDNDD